MSGHADIDRLERGGKLAEARDAALEAAGDADDDAGAAHLYARASELALYCEGPERAAAIARDACARADASGDPDAVAVSCCALARVHLREHTDAALDDAAAALAAIDESAVGDHRRAAALKLRALLVARRGRAREALDGFARAYDLADGDPALRARVLLAWAVQLRNWGLFADARRKVERSLEIRLELDDSYGAALCYGTLAFVHQRQGDHARERDALVADLRACERMGTHGDVPALRARLAGALVGLGKFAGAQAEADAAVAAEAERLGMGGPEAFATGGAERATRPCGFAWREMARVCLAQGRVADARALAARAEGVFERVGDAYGRALCQLTRAEVALARLDAGDASAAAEIDDAVAAMRPVFVRLGALPEAAETLLIEAERRATGGDARAAAARLVRQALPMLQQAGLGDTALARRVRDTAARLDPSAELDRAVTQAALLRTAAAVLVEDEPQPATVIAARVDTEEQALAFARAAVDRGAVVLWPSSTAGAAIFLGDGHAARADAVEQGLAARAGGHPVARATARATGPIDLEHLWPAGVRARGDALEAALAALERDGA